MVKAVLPRPAWPPFHILGSKYVTHEHIIHVISCDDSVGWLHTLLVLSWKIAVMDQVRHVPSKVWDEIKQPFSDFNSSIVGVRKWISNFITVMWYKTRDVVWRVYAIFFCFFKYGCHIEAEWNIYIIHRLQFIGHFFKLVKWGSGAYILLGHFLDNREIV